MIKRALPDDLVRTVSLFLEDLGTPISLSVDILLRNGEWDQISEINPDPRSYLDADLFARDAAACGILRKLQQLPTSHDRRANAIGKWRQGERDCFLSNERLRRYTSENRLSGDRCAAVDSIFELIRKEILSWIGHKPSDLAIGRFGPGATYSDRGMKSTIPHKMSSIEPTLTRGALWFLPQWLGTQWGSHFAQHHGELAYVPGNRFTTVPKNARTDRSIAAEPSINMFYQLALGRQLRRRLNKSTGWDLARAQEVHRQVACDASRTGEFATLDLSNASDTVSSTLVEVLLPHHWYDQLNDLRSKKTLIDGKWVVLEKFSSMGNGFTFELETIIFGAIACVAARECGHAGVLGFDVFVYGDDIIVPNNVAHPLKSILEFCGFTLNAEKSYYSDEPFRESCGGDYFAGKPVRPYYPEDIPNEPQEYIAFANGLYAVAQRLSLTGKALGRRAWFSILDRIPTGIRSCRGPQDLGDLVIHDREEGWTVRWRSGIRYIRALRPHKYRVIRYEGFKPGIVLACATYGVGNRRGGVIPRDGLLSYKVGWVPRS